MSKGFFSLFLVIIIAFSLSVIPQNDNLIDFGFIDDLLSQDGKPSEEDPSDTFVPEYNSNFNRDLSPETEGYIYILSLSSNEPEYAKDPAIEVDVFQHDELIKSYNTDDVIISTEDISDESLSKLIVKLDLSQKNLELTPGTYTVEIRIKDGKYTPEFSHELHFLDEYDYVGSTDTLPSGKTYLELYFMDEDYFYLIPVSRLVDSSDRQIRDTINNQFEGPNAESGLMEGSIGPWCYKAKLSSDNVLEMNFHANDTKPYDVGSSAAMYAIDSIVYSMTNIPYVDKVQFLIDEQNPASNYFHGMALEEPTGRLGWPQLYLAHNSTTEKVFLVPSNLYELKVDDVFNLLKADPNTIESYSYDYMIKNNNVIFPVPSNAVLNSQEVSGNIVTLDIDSSSLAVYDDMEKNYQLMIDAIVYTYTSFDEINRVQVLIDGEKQSDFHGIDLSKPLSPKAYINLEP